MSSNREPITIDKRVADALRALGWNQKLEPEAWLRDHVRETIERWMRDARNNGIWIRRLDDVLRVVADRLKVRIENVETDEQLELLAGTFARKGEYAFSALPREFESGVEGAVVRLIKPIPGERPLVAVVDARGERSAARFFGACHEVGHPFLEPQLSFGFRCRHGAQKPLERAVDIIAGEIALHAPLAVPLLLSHAGRDLSYKAVETFWLDDVPFSSRTAAFSAAVRLWTSPALLLVAQRRPAKHGRDKGTPPLRAVTAIGNEAARAEHLYIPPYRVPQKSAIYNAFADPHGEVHEQVEDLSWWQCSDGRQLASATVRVGARRTGDKVFAILRS
jgi:hypothetical protein